MRWEDWNSIRGSKKCCVFLKLVSKEDFHFNLGRWSYFIVVPTKEMKNRLFFKIKHPVKIWKKTLKLKASQCDCFQSDHFVKKSSPFSFIYNPNLTSKLSNFIANSMMIIVLRAEKNSLKIQKKKNIAHSSKYTQKRDEKKVFLYRFATKEKTWKKLLKRKGER